MDGGAEPVWNPKGGELFCHKRNKMMAVENHDTPASGKPRVLFEGPNVPTPRSFLDYDGLPDGQRFLMRKVAEQAQAPEQINVVLIGLGSGSAACRPVSVDGRFRTMLP